MQNKELIDLDAAQQALLIDEHTILELVQQFLDDKEHYTEPLKSALSQQDWKNLHAYAHRLKGAASNLRMHGLEEPALSLEKAAEERHADSCRTHIRVIEERFATLMELVGRG